MRLIFVKILFILSISLFLHGCEAIKNFSLSNSDNTNEYVDWDAEKFHQQAKKAMEAENYTKAIGLYQASESRYPFGEYTAQTQLDLAFAYYKNEDNDAAIAAVERFIKLNPSNLHIDYAYYLKGLVNFNRGIGFLYRFLPTDSSQRDPGNTKLAYENFAELLRRFPTSQYVSDAKKRMTKLRNNLAMHEIHVARFYMKRRAYLAAANRAGHIVKQYDGTPAVPYALEIMESAYTKLGLQGLATDASRVYAQNYPNGTPILEDDNVTFIEDAWDFIGLDKD